MTILQAVILSIVEGLTEFLPISSTAHLIITTKILNLDQNDFVKLFEIVIQSGAMLAIILLYTKKLWQNKDLIKYLTASFMPTAFFGLILYSILKKYLFQADIMIAVNLISVGAVFIIVEKMIKKKNIKLILNLKDMNLRWAFLIGIAQSFAIFPGVSRAGAVILAMLILGYKRKPAVEYSFLLAVPTILSAGAYDLYKTSQTLFLSKQEVFLITLGCIVSAITAFAAVKWLLKFLQSHTLEIFGWYRILAGIIYLMLIL